MWVLLEVYSWWNMTHTARNANYVWYSFLHQGLSQKYSYMIFTVKMKRKIGIKSCLKEKVATHDRHEFPKFRLQKNQMSFMVEKYSATTRRTHHHKKYRFQCHTSSPGAHEIKVGNIGFSHHLSYILDNPFSPIVPLFDTITQGCNTCAQLGTLLVTLLEMQSQNTCVTL